MGQHIVKQPNGQYAVSGFAFDSIYFLTGENMEKELTERQYRALMATDGAQTPAVTDEDIHTRPDVALPTPGRFERVVE